MRPDVPTVSPAFDEPVRGMLVDLLRWRRDVRRFRRDALPDDIVARLVREASLAPSVGYSQPWRFVSVEDPQRRAAVVESFERCNARALAAYSGERRDAYAQLKLAGLRDAPVHLAVFVDDESEAGAGLGRATMPQTLEYSVVGAIYAFWLLARAHDIGVGWVSILDASDVARALDIPAAWRLVAYLCVGYPDADYDTPELARERWQDPLDAARTLHRR